MDLLEVFAQFFTLPVLIFMIGIWIATFFSRRFVQLMLPKIVSWKWWTELLLPSLPIFIGTCMAVEMNFPFTLVLSVHPHGNQAFQGAICGAVATIGYRMIKGLAKQKYNVDLPDITSNDIVPEITTTVSTTVPVTNPIAVTTTSTTTISATTDGYTVASDGYSAP